MGKLSSRSIAVAEAIRDRKPFETYGALQGGNLKYLGMGWLNAEEAARFRRDYSDIAYAVYSYGTPIAWVLRDGATHLVNQRFSVTTTKHQGKLYLLNA